MRSTRSGYLLLVLAWRGAGLESGGGAGTDHSRGGAMSATMDAREAAALGESCHQNGFLRPLYG